MITTIVPVLIAGIGLLLWLISANPKVSEIGKILFMCGTLVTVWQLASHAIRIG